jgi:hypothetical protein
MATSSLISDYMQYGLLASRPVTPSVPASATALYYATDNGNTYAWSGAAWVQVNVGSTPGASIVQSASMAGGTEGSVTMGVAPTNGNLLVAMVFDFGNSAVGGAGWTGVQGLTGAGDGIGWGWKIAGAGESTTQSPASNAQLGCVAVYELALGNEGLAIAVKDVNTATLAISARATKPNQLIIGAVDCQAGGITPTGITGADHSSTLTGVNRSITLFDVKPVAAGIATINVTWAAAHVSAYLAMAVG